MANRPRDYEWENFILAHWTDQELDRIFAEAISLYRLERNKTN